MYTTELCQDALVRILDSGSAFRSFIESRGLRVPMLSASEALDLMIAFYLEVRADDALGFDQDGDMLLFQYGIFDWGRGPASSTT